MRRSIRWTLLVSYAAILALVIGTLSAFLYLREKNAVLGEAHAVLEAHAHAIANAIEWDEEDGFEVELRGDYRRMTLPGIPDPGYFAAWAPDGASLVQSPHLPAPIQAPPALPTETRERWEALLKTPEGATILVGRRMDSVMQRIAGLRNTTLAGAAGALALALLGGWLLVRRVLEPIDRISEAASRISASNLQERIDIPSTESELGRLATTLNDAFGRLEGAVERQARFTADASHELRTPLSVVLASTDWALRRERKPGEYVESLETAQRAALRMRALVDDLLALARSDAGALPLRLEDVDLEVVAREAASMMAPVARERGVEVEVGGEPARTQGDAERLLAVLTGLLSNAVAHAQPHGRVHVRCGLDEGAAWLEVADDGEGIAERDLEKVFERFYRVDDSRSGGQGGTGLGLAIAREVVELHGGRLTARSTPGAGAIFRIALPT